MKVWSVATGNVDPRIKGCRRAVSFIKKQKGLIGGHPHPPNGSLWLFRTEDDAKRARNRMEARGILCGDNICEGEIEGEQNLEKIENALKHYYLPAVLNQLNKEE